MWCWVSAKKKWQNISSLMKTVTLFWSLVMLHQRYWSILMEASLMWKKLYEQYLRCVYQAVNEMSKNPSEETFESLSMDWKPCTFGGKDKFVICLLINDKLLDCMKTTFTKPEPIRCYHREGCDHQEGCGCHNYTSPSVTRSKIGKLRKKSQSNPASKKSSKVKSH